MGNIFKKTLLGLVISSTFGIANADEISAQSWLVANEQGEIISGKNTTEIRSIASITKLMTAMVVIDSGQSLDEVVPKKLYGVNLTRRQLITLAIVKSDNIAARYLCEYYPGGFNACISAMNLKAMSLNMTNTTFTDSTGLQHTNVSTAEDLVKLLAAASQYEAIQEDSNKNIVSWQVNKKQKIVFRNTNPIVANERFAVSKTGYIQRAGGCIAMIVSTIQGTKTIIILGSRTISDRIPEARILISKF
jgi:D-alanyl-D-alanine endopeptidase (penicillin-binding protein 7)